MAIIGFRHKGLERFFVTGAKSGIQAKHAQRLRLILGRLNVATSAQDMDLPGFTCAERDVDRVDYEDYHRGQYENAQSAAPR